MSEYLKDIPEFFENSLGDSLSTRTDQLGMIFNLCMPRVLLTISGTGVKQHILNSIYFQRRVS
jgi:hypothetical protein